MYCFLRFSTLESYALWLVFTNLADYIQLDSLIVMRWIRLSFLFLDLKDQLIILHLPQSLAPNATPWPNGEPNIDQGQRRQYHSGKEHVCPSDADAIYDELDGGDQDRCQATPHEVVLWHKVRDSLRK